MPNPIKNISRLALSLLVLTALGASPLRAQKLIDLIPGLYGGDGILLATAEAASHTAHFSIGSAASINRLNQQIAAEVGGFPVSSAVGGFSFEFDPVLGDFVPTAESLGPIMAERAEGIGKGGFNLNLSFTHFSYDRFSGFDLGRFAVVARHDPDIIGFPDVRDQFEEDVLRIDMDLDIDVRLVALAANYGLSESAEIGLLLPYAAVDMQVRSKARIDEGSGNSLSVGIHSFAP